MSTLRVFINYRREDTAGHAGRLYDALAEQFGEDSVFMDIDAIEPGMDFGKVVDSTLGACDVLIALIGTHWLGVTDARGVRRLDKPEDWVRMELRRALDHEYTRVVPALVQGAEMPSSEELPEALRDLTFRNAIELSDSRWNYDVGRLIQSLERLEAEKTGEAPAEPEDKPAAESPPKRRRRRPLLIAGAIIALLAIVGIAVGGGSGGGGSDGSKKAAATTSGAAAKSSSAVLADQGCAKEKSLSSSEDATTKSQITFENKTANRVSTYWLDYNGKRTAYGSLGPGESGKQDTYATQPWVVTNASGKCLAIYAAATSPARAVVAPVAPLKDQGCAKEKSVRPGGDDAAKSKVVFGNETTSPVQIFWINSAGKREPYGSLEPGQSQSQQTYDKDPWVVADTEGKCVAVYVAGPEPAHAVISGA